MLSLLERESAVDIRYPPATVLVVDDMPDNIDLIAEALGSAGYAVRAANNGKAALKLATERPPDIILLDVVMPDMSGHEVCRALKEDPRTAPIPVIFLTALGEREDERIGLELGAVDYIVKPINPAILVARVRTHEQLRNQNRALEEQVRRRTEDLLFSRMEIVRRLGMAAEFRDNETGTHVIRVGQYARILAEECGLSPAEIDIVHNAAPMHDVGKIGIPDSILRKPARLSAAERKEMQKHAEFGARIIGEHADPLLRAARTAALTHHEKWDGSGYPRGIGGEDIPLIGRIVSIGDVFDALTHDRPYKTAWSSKRAFSYVESKAGASFDPRLADIFLKKAPEVENILKSLPA